ncbi:NAD(P)-binding domain superfamily [Arabidopsis thaliana x Arabidopsis arenosa]|uniref:NAD(P)-binding domain superfamily n=1 Tax=Arabidopsis thaliana x Arabidopsis arenosa TaxID=1240361 RepID=A0A8T1XR93_9BRAS|nr:NAD(P)-binding domain superfamily [Arabidopsis thaliana x Arabidopsis arenosa]
MDSINKIINFVFPLLTLYALLVFYPTYQRLKSAFYIYRNLFSENVAGKVVVITGAASGIGEALAYEYGKRGAYLALVDIRDEPLFHVASLAELYGSPEVIPIVADVSKLEDCESFTRTTVLHFGRLDHLVTNAGVAPLYLFEDIEDLSKASPAMDINFWGSVYCTFFASPYLKKFRGRIVASKAAVIAFYETLRTEFGSDIGVTIVAPGIVDSEMSRGKFMTKDGKFIVDKELRDVQISVLPVESAERCAKAIMRSVCRGDRYLLEPDWIGCVILLKVFCSEATESVARWMLIPGPTFPMTKALSKKILDVANASISFFSLPHY